ncbi:MAG: glutaminase A [Chitinophagales bacterium]|nr:glutaminase A [Chitinophagales bacterium]
MPEKKTAKAGAKGSGNGTATLSKESHAAGMSLLDLEYFKLFNALDLDSSGLVPLSRMLKVLKDIGIKSDDPRIKLSIFSNLEQGIIEDRKLTFDDFKEIIKQSKGSLISDAIQGNLEIPAFKEFTNKIKSIFEKTKGVTDGKVATYIPQLGRVNPEQYAVSICSVSGQRESFGDADKFFCIQSISKPVNYCLALEELGEEFVHKHVGREPSGISFNSLSLNKQGLPHNPMINSGAIMTCSMVKPQLEMADRFDYVLDTWTRLCGGLPAKFNNSVYLSERQTADRNFALGYFMRENKAFPDNTNLIDTLEFYFQCCSIEVSSDALSIAAATLANGGICPITGERIFKPDTVKNCLSLMYSCGMYDFSGEFAFTIGLPAKSGVAGGLMIVVPNLLGMAVWSPRLDAHGNSVRGLEFCKELVKDFNFHNYDSLISASSNKVDPRLRKNESKIDGVISLCFAASTNDLLEIKQLVARGVNINDADYDGRTALHLAASEGYLQIVQYLVNKGAAINALDRWGNTPLDDARRGEHHEIVNYLSGQLS